MPPDIAALTKAIADLETRAAALRRQAEYSDDHNAYLAECAQAERLRLQSEDLFARLTRLETKRKADLAAIHASAKKQGIDEDLRRAMVQRLTAGRTQSSGEMGAAERAALLRELGGGSRPGARAKSNHARPSAAKDKPMLYRVEQLLAEAGLPPAYAEAILRRQRRIADKSVACPLPTATDPELRGVIAALYRRAHPSAPRRA